MMDVFWHLGTVGRNGEKLKILVNISDSFAAQQVPILELRQGLQLYMDWLIRSALRPGVLHLSNCCWFQSKRRRCGARDAPSVFYRLSVDVFGLFHAFFQVWPGNTICFNVTGFKSIILWLFMLGFWFGNIFISLSTVKFHFVFLQVHLCAVSSLMCKQVPAGMISTVVEF